jgi:membrane-bound serine protease (ClpP class)
MLRRPTFPALALVAAAGVALAAADQAPAPEAPPRVLVLSVTGAITGGTAEYVGAGLAKARAERYAAVAISLDTPGGQLDATREIVQAMLASEVPTLVWVGPAGARAGSAGVFLSLAADVATMHPTSNIGAAHPVTGTGRDVAEEAGKDMAKKVENDTAAFARSVAAAKGRSADWAEKAVRESVSATAEEAVKLGVVDFTVTDLAAAVAKADGRKIRTSGTGERTFRGKNAVLEPYEKTVRQRLLSFLANPNVVALLMLLGTLGVAIEFYHPGAVLPGVLGGFALFLAFIAMRVIPVNVGAVLLILAGVALFVAEAYVTTHGIAGVGGAICIVLGTLFFVDTASPDYRFEPGALSVSPWIVWPTPVAIAAVLAFMAWKITRSRREPLQLGTTALVGAEGDTLSDVGPAGGEVFVHGEYWHARSDGPIPKGARVRVVAVEGLTVAVAPAPPKS